mgnify:CR=1 FL=1|jgi:dCMP deaminase
MPLKSEIDKVFMNMALNISKLSKDPSRKVGAIIVSEDGRHFSVGYNGFPKGLQESKEKWEKPAKYDYVQHAELNAIMNCPWDCKGATIYVTLQPCHRCLGALRNSGIKNIVYLERYESTQNNRIVWNEIAQLFEGDVRHLIT